MLSKLVKDFLEFRELIGGQSGWKGYVGKLPDTRFTPDCALAVIDEQAQPEGDNSNYISDGVLALVGHVKIIIRGVDIKPTLEHFEKICRELDTVANEEIVDSDGVLMTLQSCSRTSGIQYNGLDPSQRRHLASITYSCPVNS